MAAVVATCSSLPGTLTPQSSQSSLDDVAPLQDHSLQRMCACVSTLIDGIGEDAEREGLRDTPMVGGWSLSDRPIACASILLVKGGREGSTMRIRTREGIRAERGWKMGGTRALGRRVVHPATT